MDRSCFELRPHLAECRHGGKFTGAERNENTLFSGEDFSGYKLNKNENNSNENKLLFWDSYPRPLGGIEFFNHVD